MEDNVLFEYFPYKTDKTIKVCFWIFVFVFIGLIITGILMIIEGLIKKDYVEIISSIIPFVFAISIFFLLLSFKNRRLQIFSDHISIYSSLGKEKIYILNTKLMTIQVKYTATRNRGFKLTFLDRNCSKICSYILLESVTSQNNFIERRRNWGEGLKNIGCYIKDKGHYFLDANNNSADNQIKDDSCLYIRTLLKRNYILFRLLYLFGLFFVIGIFLMFYIINIIDFTRVIAVIIVVIIQFIPLTVMTNKFRKMLDYDDKKLLDQEFSKHVLERRKKS